jgi:hypothetical protein
MKLNEIFANLNCITNMKIAIKHSEIGFFDKTFVCSVEVFSRGLNHLNSDISKVISEESI